MKTKEEILKNYKNLAKEELENFKVIWIKCSVCDTSFESLKILPSEIKDKLKEGHWIDIWVNGITGDIVFEKPDSTLIVQKRTSAASISIDEDNDCIKITKVYMDLSCMWHEKVINKSGKYKVGTPEIYLSYIFKDKTVICNKCSKYRHTRELDDITPVMIYAPDTNISDAQNQYGGFGLSTESYCDKNTRNIFSKFFGMGLISGNTYTNFYDLSDALKFLCTKDVLYKDTPKQRKVDELVKIELPEVSLSFNRVYDNLICVANRVNDEYAVLRYFKPMLDKTPYEVSRLYVSKKDYYFARKNQEEKFCICNRKLNAEHFQSNDMVLDSEDIFDGTMLEYFKDIYKSLKRNERGKALYVLTTQPTFEKFYKMGFDTICTQYIKSYNGDVSWKKHLEDYFGPIDNIKEKNINKMLGFNKYQMEKLKAHQDIYKFNEKYSWLNDGWESMNCGFGACLKNLFEDIESFNDMDNASFDKIFDFFNIVLAQNCYKNDKLKYFYQVLETMLELYPLKTCLNVLPSFKNVIEKTNSSGFISYDYSYLRTFTDFLNTVQQLDKTNEIKPYFNTREDLIRMHDDAFITLNLQKSNFETEKFKNRSSFWKKWEYNEDDDFVAIAPTVPADLAVEGITLHHCVKSYISRVTDGKTNIMFIRKKDNTEKPFFTVEISNKGDIEQVHGFANRNADTEPGLETFVEKWAKERKLKLNGINKVR